MRTFYEIFLQTLFLCYLFLAHGQARALDFRIENVPSSFVRTTQHNIEINEYKSYLPPKIVFSESLKIASCRINNSDCGLDTKNSFLLKDPIRSTTFYNLTYKISDQPKERHLQIVMGPKIPKYKFTGHSSVDDKFFLTPIEPTVTSNALLALNPDGTIFFYREMDRPVIDFKPHRVDGKWYFSYLEIEKTVAFVTFEGRRVILNDHFNYIETLPWTVDVHEFLMFTDKHFLFLRHEVSTNPLGICEMSPVIYEFKKYKMLRKIEVLKFFDLGFRFFQSRPESVIDTNCIRLAHLNVVQKLPNDKYLLGLTSIVLFDYAKNQIDWVFGGINGQFDLPMEHRFFINHTASWDESSQTLLAFKNSSPVNPNGSEILEFNLDVNKKKIIKQSVLSLFKYSEKKNISMGSVYKLSNGSYTAGLGIRYNEKNPVFVEILEGKATVLFYLDKSYQAAGYRVYRANPTPNIL